MGEVIGSTLSPGLSLRGGRSSRSVARPVTNWHWRDERPLSPILFLARYGFDRAALNRIEILSKITNRCPLAIMVAQGLLTSARYYRLLARDCTLQYQHHIDPSLVLMPSAFHGVGEHSQIPVFQLQGQNRRRYLAIAPPLDRIGVLRAALREQPLLRQQLVVTRPRHLADLVHLARAHAAGISWPVELAFLLRLITDPITLADLRRPGTGSPENLFERAIGSGLLKSTAAYQALADELELPFQTASRSTAPGGSGGVEIDPRLTTRLTHLLSSDRTGEMRMTVAPTGPAINCLHNFLAENSRQGDRLAITTPARLRDIARLPLQARILDAARGGLKESHPHYSAAHPIGWKQLMFPAFAIFATATASLVLPAARSIAASSILSVLFLIFAFIRVRSAVAVHQPRTEPPQLADRQLPAYTVLVPVYQEADCIAPLIAALDRLSYPQHLLDIKLIVEADDRETRAAIYAVADRRPYDVIVVPAATPRTKPKALNHALAYATGDLITVYDAEDRPEPDQLRKAAAAFYHGPAELGCVQASLAIDHAGENWFSRQFAFEYAALFDGILPWLAAHDLWFPLGGTSNHFRRDVLESVGRWDPHNVTEDADLGLRLRRFGYRMDVLDSVTWEEAPLTWQCWLSQRTRWYKGWLQTWLVHMRYPLKLWRDLGWRDFLAFQVLLGGSLAALVAHIVFVTFWAGAILGLVTPLVITTNSDVLAYSVFALSGGGGYGAAIWLAARAGGKRLPALRWRHLAWMPAYWLMMAIALGYAALELIRAPHYWAKSPHGVSRYRKEISP